MMKRFQNRKNIKRIVALTLFLLLTVVPVLAGCQPTQPPVYDTRLNFLSSSGVSIYRIVYPEENCPNTVLTAAEELQAIMGEVLGVDVAITDDKGTANAIDQFQPYEILVGETARTATQKALPELDGEEFIVRVDGHKIVIVGASNRATCAGVRYFIDNVIKQGSVEHGRPVVKIETDYEYYGQYESPKQPAVAGDTTLPVAPYRPVILYAVQQPEQLDNQLTLATLQGLSTLFSSEQIFVLKQNNQTLLDTLVAQGASVTEHNDEEQTWTLELLLEYYRDRLSGYILCGDAVSESAEVAINLAHYLGAVVVTPENEALAQEAGLSLVLDVTDKNDAWLRTTPYFEKLSKTVAIEPDMAQGFAFVDYAVMSGCYYRDYCSGDEYMHIQSFRYLSAGAYLLCVPTDDVHQTLTFEEAGIEMLTPDSLYYENLSLMISANAKETEAILIAKK